MWNTDETSVELGVSSKKVLAQRGEKILYNVTSSNHDHITTVLTVNVANHMVRPRCVFHGIRNVAATHLASLPNNGKSGTCGISSAPK